ncbi:Zinc finger and SCAN domain-containing protein 31-like [Homarus americanus]|uniref:Zinc finger and SCAN domain-containing protein 31-like n=2 Tax=Homarus americanus TaxID=6706 RepID=A0A8J5JCJ7_HOMAM|nr:Zinc finger and SCAN domain-containing protein 31-like [Homarus americanus]
MQKRPYSCPMCGKTFPRKGGVTRHLAAHSQEKPHQCKECGMKFSLISKLKRHVKIHTTPKDFVCETCGQRFLMKTELEQHKIIHIGEKDNGCRIYDNGYSTSKRCVILHTNPRTVNILNENESIPGSSAENSFCLGDHMDEDKLNVQASDGINLNCHNIKKDYLSCDSDNHDSIDNYKTKLCSQVPEVSVDSEINSSFSDVSCPMKEETEDICIKDEEIE